MSQTRCPVPGASFLCGISWNLASLIVFRVLQGAVSGPMIPGSQALLIMIFPPRQRGTALAIWSMTTLVAPITGPILGGYISDNFSWPWIFLINVPVGLLAMAILAVYLREPSRDTTRRPRLDIAGAITLLDGTRTCNRATAHSYLVNSRDELP